MQDQPVVRVEPERLGHDVLKLEFDLKNVLARRESGTIRDAEDVRVDREGFLMKGSVEDDVGCLAADAGEFLQFLSSTGHLAAVIADQRFGQSDDVLGLGVEQANCLDRATDVVLA